MQTEQTIKRSYTVTAKGNPETFQDRKQFLSWSLAIKYLNEYITQQPMSLILTTDTEVVKAYHFKQRVSLQA